MKVIKKTMRNGNGKNMKNGKNFNGFWVYITILLYNNK